MSTSPLPTAPLPTPPVLALDIGGTSLRAALVQGTEVRERRQAPTPQPATPDAVLGAAAELARPLAFRAGRLGVACAGAIHGSVVRSTSEHIFPGWAGTPLAARLGEALGLPAAVLNDARAAAWAEAQLGAGRGVRDFMFVTVSTGIGAGLVLGGRLHQAGNGLDAELGLTLVPRTDGAGLRLLELEASGRALDEQAPALGFVSSRDLCGAAETGHPQAEAAYSRSAALLAWKLADVAALLGVTRVALGGSVGLRPGYRERVARALAELPTRHTPEVVSAALGPDAGLIGAGLIGAGPMDTGLTDTGMWAQHEREQARGEGA